MSNTVISIDKTGAQFACALFSDITLDMILGVDKMMLLSRHWSI